MKMKCPRCRAVLEVSRSASQDTCPLCKHEFAVPKNTGGSGKKILLAGAIVIPVLIGVVAIAAMKLRDKPVQVAIENQPTPTPVVPKVTPTPLPVAPSPTPIVTPSPTPMPVLTPTPTVTPTPTAYPSPTLTPAQPLPTPTIVPSPTPTQSVWPTPTPKSAKPAIKFTINGWRIGDSITLDFAYKHVDDMFMVLGSAAYEYNADQKAAEQKKKDILASKIREGIDITVTDYIEGVQVGYEFHKSKLVSVNLSYPTATYSTLVKLYTEKFGQSPHQVTNEEVSTKMGVKYQNETVSWQTDAGEFFLMRYGANIERGFGSILTPESKKLMDEERKKKEENLKSKL